MGFFSFFKKKEKSKDIAKERLKLVLVQDRSNISPNLLEEIRKEILDIMSKYADVEEEGMDIKLTRMKRQDSSTVSAIVANIPFTNPKSEEELESR